MEYAAEQKYLLVFLIVAGPLLGFYLFFKFSSELKMVPRVLLSLSGAAIGGLGGFMAWLLLIFGIFQFQPFGRNILNRVKLTHKTWTT